MVTLEGTSRKGKLSFFRATRKSFARPNPTFFELKKGISDKGREREREKFSFFYFFLPWIDVSYFEMINTFERFRSRDEKSCDLGLKNRVEETCRSSFYRKNSS